MTQPLEIALITAVKQGNVKSFNIIVNTLTANTGVGDINGVDDAGRTALHYAIEGNTENHYECFKRLLVNKSRVDIFDHRGQTALHAAIELEESEFDYFDQLVQFPERLVINQHQGQTPSAFIYACRKKHWTQVKTLIDLGADLYATLENFSSLFMWLVEENDAETIELFLKSGMDALDIDLHKTDPLLTAISKGHSATVKVLLRFGYGIAVDFTKAFLQLEDMQDDFYWLVGSRATNHSLEEKFPLAATTQKKLVKVKKRLTNIRKNISTFLPLTEAQRSILLSRIEVEWQQWDESSSINREIEKLYALLKTNQPIRGEFQESKFDYLFNIPDKKLRKKLTLDVCYDHTALLRWITLNQKGGLLTRVFELIIQHPDLTDIRQKLLFLAHFSKEHGEVLITPEENRNIGKEEESDDENEAEKKEINTKKELDTKTLAKRFINNYNESYKPTDPRYIDFNTWRTELAEEKNVIISNEALGELTKDSALEGYFGICDIYHRTVEVVAVEDKALPLKNTLLTLNHWIRQIDALTENYENYYLPIMESLFGVVAFLSALTGFFGMSFLVGELAIGYGNGNFSAKDFGVAVGITVICMFLFVNAYGCIRHPPQIVHRLDKAMFRFFMPAAVYRDNFTSLQGLQKILLTLRTYLLPEQHRSLLNVIDHLTRSNGYLTLQQTTQNLTQLSQALQTLTTNISHQINHMDIEHLSAIALPGRFAVIDFYPEVTHLEELASKYTKNEVTIEIEKEEPITETTPLMGKHR